MKLKCPKCGKETEYFINDAIDEEGEVFMCKYCHYQFRYTEKLK